MNSTQLSESFNKSLNDYLKLDYDVIQFFMHFENALINKRYKESEAEYNLCYKSQRVTIPVTMLKQDRGTYTKLIFEEFQNQYVQSLEVCIKTVFKMVKFWCTQLLRRVIRRSSKSEKMELIQSIAVVGCSK